MYASYVASHVAGAGAERRSRRTSPDLARLVTPSYPALCPRRATPQTLRVAAQCPVAALPAAAAAAATTTAPIAAVPRRPMPPAPDATASVVLTDRSCSVSSAAPVAGAGKLHAYG
jgi:hypothetical protein